MEFIKCKKEHTNAVTKMYRRCVNALEEKTNYPKWSNEHPSNEYIAESVAHGELFACTHKGTILGAAVLSENPEGSYELGNWNKELKRGEYLVIHTLAVSPDYMRKGIGLFLVEGCISYAKDNGYRAIRLDVVPDNIPAVNLYKNNGFTYAGSNDLNRNIEYIPIFDLYELNL